MKILLTGAGGAAAVSVWKSLHSKHTLYMGDMDPCAAGLYLVPAPQRVLLPAAKRLNFVSHLLHLCKTHAIDVLIPTVDAELFLLVEAEAQFKQVGTIIPLSSAKTLALCRDKHALLTRCQDTGFVAPFELLTEQTPLNQIELPCFAKPRCGAGSAGALVINHLKELEALPCDGSYLIQRLLPGEEYSVDVYFTAKGQALASVPRLRMKIDSGIAVAAQTCIKPDLSAMAIAIAKKANIRYVANVQFKQDPEGQFKLLEINPRFPGTLPLTAAAGIDLAQLLIDEISGQEMPSELLPFKEMMVARYWTEEFFAIEEWRQLCQQQISG